jgi:hypothetical protein
MSCYLRAIGEFVCREVDLAKGAFPDEASKTIVSYISEILCRKFSGRMIKADVSHLQEKEHHTYVRIIAGGHTEAIHCRSWQAVINREKSARSPQCLLYLQSRLSSSVESHAHRAGIICTFDQPALARLEQRYLCSSMEGTTDLFLLRQDLPSRSDRLHVSKLKNANRRLFGLLSASLFRL